MRCYISVVCALSVLATLSYAAPATLDQLETEQIAVLGQQDRQLAAMLTDPRLRRDLSFLSLIDFNQVAKIIERVDIPQLRKMFPTIFRILDNVIQNVTSQAFSIIGRAVLQSGGLGGGGGGGGGESRVSVVLPSFDDDDDEEDDDDDTPTSPSSTTAAFTSVNLGSRIADVIDDRVLDVVASNDQPSPSEALKIAPNTSDSSTSTSTSTGSSTTTTTTTTTTRKEGTSSISTEASSNNEIGGSTTSNSINLFTVRLSAFLIVAFISSLVLCTKQPAPSGAGCTSCEEQRKSPATDDGERKVRTIRASDQDVSASGGNAAPSPNEDLSNLEDDADRDKRFLPFGLSASADHGATGGSGNFLFDIIRRTADGAARAAGTVYRMVAGTDTLGIGLTASSTSTKTLAPTATSQLVAGSGATEATDEKDNAPGLGGVAEIDVAAKGDGYTEGIPGPITRLFVLANRGLANLVQDLILRLAQTSERIVNFKARLVTSLI